MKPGYRIAQKDENPRHRIEAQPEKVDSPNESEIDSSMRDHLHLIPFAASALPPKRHREIELLLCCAGTLNPGAVGRIRSLACQDVDWSYIEETAIKHKVLPLLHRGLKEAGPKTAPDDVMKRLRTLILKLAEQNLIFSASLLKILDFLKSQGIPAVPFKGPVLAELIHGDLALRQFSDLDILVHGRDAFRALSTLERRGFRPEIRLNGKQFSAYRKTEDNILVIAGQGKLMVELHWEMTGRCSSLPLDLDYLLPGLESTPFLGKRVDHLSPADLLVYLCLHGNKDRWALLDSICCVSELLAARPTLDWRRVENTVDRFHCKKMLFLGLFLTNALLDARIPEPVFRKITEDRQIRKTAREVCKRLFHENHGSNDGSFSVRFSTFHFTTSDRLTDQIRLACRLAGSPTKSDWRMLPLPAALSFLYYIIRPLRLAAAYSLTVMKRRRKNLA